MGRQRAAQLPDGTEIGPYRIVRCLDSGGMAAVYEARHRVLDKRVAIKVLRPEFRQHPEIAPRFVREGQAAVRVAHPNVVDVMDVGTHDGFTFLVMEYLEGEDLDAFYGRKGWTPEQIAELPGPIGSLFLRWHKEQLLPPAVVIDLLLPVLLGVQAAHERGVIHRDLKPKNIFLHCSSEHGLVVKVVDFGISRFLDQESRTHLVMGTPSYMAPEQAYGAQNATERSDVYSLGVILYEGVTGRRPIERQPDEEQDVFLVRIRDAEPVPPRQHRPDLPEDLEKVILRALRRDPTERFASAAELGRALLPYAGETARAHYGSRIGGDTSAESLRPTRDRLRWAVAMGVGAAVLAFAVAYLHSGPGPGSGRPTVSSPPRSQEMESSPRHPPEQPVGPTPELSAGAITPGPQRPPVPLENRPPGITQPPQEDGDKPLHRGGPRKNRGRASSDWERDPSGKPIPPL